MTMRAAPCEPDLRYELEANTMGFRVVCGVDEAGRGPLAGPVVAASVILPPGKTIPGVRDSKTLTEARRAELYRKITGAARDYGIGAADVDEIERLNILRATLLAMKRAVENLRRLRPDIIIVDGGNTIPVDIPQWTVRRGDAVCHCVAAASIIAKHTRDALMREYHRKFPEYGFDRHKGYGTRRHRDMITAFGPCPIHRKTFAPVQQCLLEMRDGAEES
ncbi:MAG: ribonuclease HII [bacterium]